MERERVIIFTKWVFKIDSINLVYIQMKSKIIAVILDKNTFSTMSK